MHRVHIVMRNDGEWDVHAVGCKDVSPKKYHNMYPGQPEMVHEVETKRDVVEQVYGNPAGGFYEESGGDKVHGSYIQYLDDLVNSPDFHYLSCVKPAIPAKPAKTGTKLDRFNAELDKREAIAAAKKVASAAKRKARREEKAGIPAKEPRVLNGLVRGQKSMSIKESEEAERVWKAEKRKARREARKAAAAPTMPVIMLSDKVKKQIREEVAQLFEADGYIADLIGELTEFQVPEDTFVGSNKAYDAACDVADVVSRRHVAAYITEVLKQDWLS